MRSALRSLVFTALAVPQYVLPAASGHDGRGAAEPLQICFQHGCARRAQVLLDAELLDSLALGFAGVRTAADERNAVAVAIGRIERYVGARIGTDRDQGGTFPGAFGNGQMDCIDESTNTTQTLRLFARRGWLRWHDVSEPVTRLPIPISWWPHTAAVIRERESDAAYAVDSWFENNGEPAHILDLHTWRGGWHPGDGP